MAKFDIKKLQSAPINIQKDIDSIEKNRTKESGELKPTTEIPQKKAETNTAKTIKKFSASTEKKTVPAKKKHATTKLKAEENTETRVKETSDLKVASITLPTEVKNYLKFAPKMRGKTITSFISDMIREEQSQYEKNGIDVTKGPDYSNMPEVKSRGKGEKPVIIPIKISESHLNWVKMAALYNGLNVSRYMEELIRERM